MDIAPDARSAGSTAGHILAGGTARVFNPADRALLQLGRVLEASGYRFTTVTPASHARVLARPAKKLPSLADIFGWTRPFAARDLPEEILALMVDAGALNIEGPAFRSAVRFSTLGDQLFVHSAFPTEQADAVFFGPDTYRFARLIRQSLSLKNRANSLSPSRILDMGAGTGAGGLQAAALAAGRPPLVVLADINRRALRFCKINAALNGFESAEIVETNLFTNIDGDFDLILANPPYLVDPTARTYRHGGGSLGFELSLRIAEDGASRLASGGRLILYTGAAIVDGIDRFHEALCAGLSGRGVKFNYEEIDPDVFGEELDHPPYDRADRIAAVSVMIDAD
jgi:methylase of polypeptide subunit release factors